MADYAILFARSARRELEKLPLTIARRILSKVERLADNPRPDGVRKLQGATDLWRLRVGDYRVVYAVDDGKRIVDVRLVRHRKDAYR